MNYVGSPVARKEDRRLVTGRSQFVGDIKLSGMVEAAVLRSPISHGTIETFDVSEALAIPGVIAVFSAHDIRGEVEPFTRPFYKTIPQHVIDATGLVVRPYHAQLLADQRVFRTGEPVAVVIAEDRYIAEDALAAISIEYDSLPGLHSAEEAIADGAAQLHDDVPGNIHCRFDVSAGDVDQAFADADHHLARRIVIGRSVGSPMETRGVVAELSSTTDELRVWATQQRPHLLRSYLSEMLHRPEEAIRVISPDMGGSFGGGIYSEEILIPYIAMKLGRPVRWIEDRAENLGNARHSRDQTHDVEVCFDDDGTITGLKDRFLIDTGAYNQFAITLSYNTAAHLRSEFRIDNFQAEGICVLTNKRDNTPVRGAGRTSATFVCDRIVDMVAAALEMDPADVRRKNLIPASAMPYDMGMLYRDGGNVVYDSGDYPAQLEQALELMGYDDFRAEQQQLRTGGRYVGIGISCHVEGSGFGPHEGAMVRIDGSGHVIVHSGSNPHGQSHETVLAQVVADELGVTPDDVTVRAGDTGLIAHGGGTFASRSAVTAGSAAYSASRELRVKVLAVAGELLEADPVDLVITTGRIHPRGVPDVNLTFADVAAAASPGPGMVLPKGMGPGLEVTSYFVPPTVTFSSGTHVATVEVDVETGQVSVLRYVVVDDCGLILNPMVVDGQQHGGVAHGIGNGLFEEIIYNEDGQITNASFMDYLLPTASDVPFIEVAHAAHLSPLNPMGIKGAGEGAAVSPPAAIANGIVDALKPLDIEVNEMPITPAKLWRLIRQASEDVARA